MQQCHARLRPASTAAHEHAKMRRTIAPLHASRCTRPAARVPLHASRAMPSSRTGWATWLYPFDVGSCARVAWKGFMRPQV
jgi:hypothetical protein